MPLKHKEEFDVAWAAIINRLTLEFTQMFCSADGRIDWERLTKYVSAKEKPPPPKRVAKGPDNHRQVHSAETLT